MKYVELFDFSFYEIFLLKVFIIIPGRCHTLLFVSQQFSINASSVCNLEVQMTRFEDNLNHIFSHQTVNQRELVDMNPAVKHGVELS